MLRLANRKSIRRQALLVTVLYLFLSTVGMLTHAHIELDGDTGLPAATPAVAASVLHHTALQKGHIGDPRACPFCNWEANSVAVALPPFHLPYKAPVPEAPVGRTGSIHTAFLARFSSRAPPVSL